MAEPLEESESGVGRRVCCLKGGGPLRLSSMRWPRLWARSPHFWQGAGAPRSLDHGRRRPQGRRRQPRRPPRLLRLR